jgi:hypothetical protein
MWWDKWIVDGLVNFTGLFVRALSFPAKLLQTGLVQWYALGIVFGVLLFLGSFVYAPMVEYLRSLLHVLGG